ncbi:TetR/AcrR family transcriptional regulator [Clostridium sp. D33t1_170424_F3]|uniref:TetR/AcrR family transcriptional regulator n=1 Tax=Clostridium sp. D33t1_170424_F3 TaxID=2787099 RepID=UPI0018A88BE9|nr:TetR/AcrR family transcriptional regulator [Clostridium sp. D33t1_170424_F3]
MARKNNPKQAIENIITVSAKLFAEKGYDKTSMQDIVDALGMSKGGIFHHFKSKEDIFHAVMEKQFEQIIETVNQWLDEMHGLTAKEKLRGLINRNLMDEKIIKESSNMISSAIESPQITLAFTQNNLEKLAPIIADVIREGIEDRSISTAFPDECAEVLLLLLNFWCDTDVFQGDFPTLHKRFQFLQYLMRQLGVDILEDETVNSISDFYRKEEYS